MKQPALPEAKFARRNGDESKSRVNMALLVAEELDALDRSVENHASAGIGVRVTA
jgi:hypothetical protein